jgi:ribosomal protein L25, Ctc-form
MKKVSISGSLRENVGKKDAKMNRNKGLVPCVLYGGKEQVHFAVEEKSFKKLIFTPNSYLVSLNINGKEYNATLQDAQYHPVTDSLLHVDFMELVPGKPIVISVPVAFEGTAVGVFKGGRLIKKFRKLKVKALAEHLPDEIKINIEKLDINDSIKISDIALENIELLEPPTAIVVGVRVTRAVEPTPAEAAAAAKTE